MTVLPCEKNKSSIYNEVDAVNVLFSKLDEALDDFENGRVMTIEEAWKEIDAI